MTTRSSSRLSGHLLALALLTVVLARPSVSAAQRSAAAWQTLPIASLPSASRADGAGADIRPRLYLPSAYPRTHWKEGGVVGGILLGIVAAVLFDGLCGSDGGDEHCTAKTLGGVALGAGVGFTAGALIGGQFPKRP